MAELFERIRMQMTADDASSIESALRHMKKEMIAAQERAKAAEAKIEAAEKKVAVAEERAEAAEKKVAGLFCDNQKLTAKVKEAERASTRAEAEAESAMTRAQAAEKTLETAVDKAAEKKVAEVAEKTVADLFSDNQKLTTKVREAEMNAARAERASARAEKEAESAVARADAAEKTLATAVDKVAGEKVAAAMARAETAEAGLSRKQKAKAAEIEELTDRAERAEAAAKRWKGEADSLKPKDDAPPVWGVGRNYLSPSQVDKAVEEGDIFRASSSQRMPPALLAINDESPVSVTASAMSPMDEEPTIPTSDSHPLTERESLPS